MNFEAVWERILQCEGELFHTVRNLPFTYRIIGGAVVPDRTGFPVSSNDFLKAYNMGELKNPGQINRIVRGPSYVYAILTDPRIRD